jgi:RNA polymerase sigma-70 factor (ECF subfamily)
VTEPASENATTESVALQAALEGVFARSQPEILGTLYYLLGNWEDARDCLQETFLKCWRAREEMSQIINLKAWVFRIAINTGRDARSSAWKRRKQPLSDAEISYDLKAMPERLAIVSEQVQRLQNGIAQLRPEEREVFLLRQNGELTYEEISDTLKIPLGTVKTRMRLALQRLRSTLQT